MFKNFAFIQEAESALKYYKSYKGDTKEETLAIAMEFERMKKLAKREENSQRLQLADLCKDCLHHVLQY